MSENNRIDQQNACASNELAGPATAMEAINAFILIILTIFLIKTSLKSLRAHGFSFGPGLNIGILYFIVIPLWVALISGTLPVPTDFHAGTISDVRWGRDSYSIFLMLLPVIAVAPTFSLARYAVKALGRPHQKSVPAIDAPQAFGLFFWLYVTVTVIVYVASGLAEGGHWYHTRGDFLSDNGLVGVFLVYSISATRVLFLADIVVAFLRKRIRLFGLLAPIMTICAIDLYTTGNRIYTLQSALVIALALVISRHYRALLIGATLSIPFGFVMGTFRWARAFMHTYSGTGFSGALSGLNSGLQFALEQAAINGFGVVDFISSATESLNVNVYMEIVKNFPARHSYLYGESLYKLLVFAVPRSFWPGKPESITVTMGQLFMPGSGVSLVSTFFGELYANFGLFCLILSPIFIGLAHQVISGVMKGRTISGVACFVYAFTLVRMPYSDVVLTAVVMSLYMRLIYLSRRIVIRPMALWR